MTVHLTFTVVFFLCVLIFKWINDKSIIDIILAVAGYTYGPLLGLFGFGILTKRVIGKGALVVIICFTYAGYQLFVKCQCNLIGLMAIRLG